MKLCQHLIITIFPMKLFAVFFAFVFSLTNLMAQPYVLTFKKRK